MTSICRDVQASQMAGNKEGNLSVYNESIINMAGQYNFTKLVFVCQTIHII